MRKNVFITGGSGGLGMAIAKRHLGFGDTVWATDIAETNDVKELAAAQERLTFIKCDIGATADVQRALGSLHSAIGKLDYFYSCAGMYRLEDKRVLLPDADLDGAAVMYDVNAVGFLRVVKALLPALQNGSAIICITSEAGSIGENWRNCEYSYCMSKAAENMACAILQKHFDELKQNTRVLCIHPGWLRTQMGGPEAFANPEQSLIPEESAEKIVGIAVDIESIPKESMYMDYNRKKIKW